jgi:hypothetical protein
MKYLKTFEGWEMLVPKEEHYNGLTKEYIEDMFVDISDAGYNTSTYFDKNLIQRDTSVDKEDGKMVIESIPYIRCVFQELVQRNANDVGRQKEELEDYIKSSEFKEIIETTNDRLGDFGWYISKSKVVGYQLKIFMHRIEDIKIKYVV